MCGTNEKPLYVPKNRNDEECNDYNIVKLEKNKRKQTEKKSFRIKKKFKCTLKKHSKTKKISCKNVWKIVI